MDPVTAIQLVPSLLSLIKACRASLQAIKDFKNGDVDFGDFLQDVEIFVAFVQALERVLGHMEQRRRTSLPEGMQRALQETRKTLIRLDKKLEHIKKADSSAARRIKWLQGRAELQKLQDNIRNHKLSLHSFMALICM
jgi:hypothetical protein